MRRAPLYLAASCVPLLLAAAPAYAKGPHATHSAREAFRTARVPSIAPPLRLTREEAAATAAKTAPIAAPNDSPVTMIGNWPVIGDVNVGVGLFSVVGATEKEQMRRRADPMRAMTPASTRVAAVGLKLSF